jgi:acyl-coenzyme A synthetase/AMP-(fatty) acid ligase
VVDGGKRWYHTGDKVLRHEDVYICKGRLDSQVKIAGHRVELLDVESHLRAMDGVENAVCFTRGRDSERHIVAILITQVDLGLLHVRTHLADKLPAYMLPRRVHCVSDAPTNRSGKLDRLALKGRFET